MKLNGKRILITGAAGFIGSHLTEQCVALGAQTRAFVRYTSTGKAGWLDGSAMRDDMEIVHGDIRDRDCLRQAMRGVDIVFHLAALIGIPYSYHAPDSYVQTNISGTLNVLQTARELEVKRMVHTSTSEVYGTARTVPMPETHPLQAQSPYSASKIGADKMAESFFNAFGVPVVTVRPFNTYGPRQSLRAVIPTIIRQVLSSDTIALGNLNPTRDLNFVSDTVAGFLAASQSADAVGEVVNLGTGKEISIGRLAEMIKEITGSRAEIIEETQRVRPQDSEVERLLADNQRARDWLHWDPQVTLSEGLEKTIDWIRQHTYEFDTSRYVI